MTRMDRIQMLLDTGRADKIDADDIQYCLDTITMLLTSMREGIRNHAVNTDDVTTTD